MASQVLGQRVKRTIRKASREAVAESLRSWLNTSSSARTWISSGNSYRLEALKRLKGLQKRGKTNSPVKRKALLEYVSASGPVHVIDGWSYLGRAADALLRGDSSTSIHLAYYAELRAAFALLGLNGVGVFNNFHATITDTGHVIVFGSLQTHAFVWPALEWWSQPRSIQEQLLRTLRPSQIGIWEWLEAFASAANAVLVGRRWLRQWGLDLIQLRQDHLSRNEVSYRPSRFRQASSVPAVDTVNFITDLWRLFEPTSDGRFDTLDRYLLRIAVERVFQNVSGSMPASSPAEYENAINTMLQHVGFPDDKVQSWSAFLRRIESPNDPRPIVAAQLNISTSDSDLAIQVISRAALLLRLATASAHDILRSAGITSIELGFWWHTFGEERGLWPPGAQPPQASDTWADVSFSLSETGSWAQGAPAGTFSDFHDKQPRHAIRLGAFELISLWGLAS